MKKSFYREDDPQERMKRSSKIPASLKNAFLTAYTEGRLTIKQVLILFN